MSFSAEIIAVGTEILLGDIANTDAQEVSQCLSELGINVYYHTVVGDNPDRLKKAVAIAKERADIIITTGGLGPTYDDLTKQTLAECFGLELELNEEELENICAYFKKLGREMTDNNKVQAYLPKGCTVLKNDWGTAPGCAFFAENTHVIMLPGPPSECVPMMKSRAMPYLEKLSDGVIVSHNIRIVGMGESSVEAKLREEMESMKNPTLAPYAKEGEVLLRVTGKAEDKKTADQMTKPVVEKIKDVFGLLVYGVDVENLESVVVEKLKKHGLTLATAESCTGGLLSQRITSVPGSSACYLGGVCSYTNRIKNELLDVREKTIEENGAVSKECAQEMASGVAFNLNADIGVSITGIAGPDGGSKEKPVGTVYISIYHQGTTWTKRINQPGSRLRVRNMSATTALDMVRRLIVNKYEKEF